MRLKFQTNYLFEVMTYDGFAYYYYHQTMGIANISTRQMTIKIMFLEWILMERSMPLSGARNALDLTKVMELNSKMIIECSL